MHRATFDLVWLGVLILTPGVGVPAGPVCPAFPLRFRLGLSAGGRVRPVGVVPGWPGTAGTRPAPTASAAEGASGGGGRSGPAGTPTPGVKIRTPSQTRSNVARCIQVEPCQLGGDAVGGRR